MLSFKIMSKKNLAFWTHTERESQKSQLNKMCAIEFVIRICRAHAVKICVGNEFQECWMLENRKMCLSKLRNERRTWLACQRVFLPIWPGICAVENALAHKHRIPNASHNLKIRYGRYVLLSKIKCTKWHFKCYECVRIRKHHQQHQLLANKDYGIMNNFFFLFVMCKTTLERGEMFMSFLCCIYNNVYIIWWEGIW